MKNAKKVFPILCLVFIFIFNLNAQESPALTQARKTRAEAITRKAKTKNKFFTTKAIR
jgi:F0F1-type ATP synthase membrane subunit a